MRYNVHYKGEKIHESLSPEDLTIIIQDFALDYHEGNVEICKDLYIEEVVDEDSNPG